MIIPTHDRPRLLGRALASVSSQTFADFEVVVGVDGLFDDAISVLSQTPDPRVRWFIQDNQGASATRNAAIELAQGEWVAFLDDDNEWRPEFIAHQLATATQSGADVVYCLGADEQPDGSFHEQRHPPSADPLQNAVHGWYPLTSTLFVRRSELVRLGGFSPRLDHFEDWHLVLRLAQSARWGFTNETMLLRPFHGEPRLSDRLDDGNLAIRILERDVGASLRRRIGWRAYMRWFRRNRGQFIIDLMHRDAQTIGRRAGLNALISLAPSLPWSAKSMVRPLAMVAVGQERYGRLLKAYSSLYRYLAHRQ